MSRYDQFDQFDPFDSTESSRPSEPSGPSDASDRFEQFEHLERQFDPLYSDRKARRSRKPKARHVPKKADREVIHEIADVTGLEGGFKTTYRPALFEEGWLLQSLQSFYDQTLIQDILMRVKGGKEATVYCCAAHPSTGTDLLAAKVYRPRMFRQLRNDKLYREGREILTADGQPVKKNDHRTMRAIGKKTAYGAQVAHSSWLLHEYKTLKALHRAGAAVPEPYAVAENAILMSYCGDASLAAPALSEVTLHRKQAVPLFHEVIRNITLMLDQGVVHGDLSAYNILFWEGEITLIDFPQVTPVATNRNAFTIFRRDVLRVCEYFTRQGVICDAEKLARDLWDGHTNVPEDVPEEDEADRE